MFSEKIICDSFEMIKPNLSLAHALVSLVKNNQTEFKYVYHTKTLIEISKAEKELQSMIDKWDKKEQYCYLLVKENQLLGYAGIKVRLSGHVAELSYYLDKKFIGHGYISKALTSLTNIFFDNGGHRTEIFCNENNVRSVGVAQRLGYHLDGVMREYELIDGQYEGIAIYSKIKEDETPGLS